MSKNYLELQKYFPEFFEKVEDLSLTFISEPLEDSKDELKINNFQFKELKQIV
jgi:hypothetical protein